MKHNQGQLSLISKGDVVIIKGEERNRGYWKLGIVEELFPGRDGVVRSVRLRAGKSYQERPIQHLYPLELSCGRTADVPNRTLNPQAPVFRSTRDAAVAARVRIQSQAEDEQCSQMPCFDVYCSVFGHDLVTSLCSFLSEMNRGSVLVIFRLRDSNITSFSDRHVDYIRLSYLKQLQSQFQCMLVTAFNQ